MLSCTLTETTVEHPGKEKVPDSKVTIGLWHMSSIRTDRRSASLTGLERSTPPLRNGLGWNMVPAYTQDSVASTKRATQIDGCSVLQTILVCANGMAQLSPQAGQCFIGVRRTS
eukprot:4930449-Amphidinium_carterae.1